MRDIPHDTKLADSVRRVSVDIYSPQGGWSGFVYKIVMATVLMGIFLVLMQGGAQSWFEAGVAERVARLAFLVVVGGAIYGVALLGLGLRPGQLRQP